MNFSADELFDLCSADGGRFSCSGIDKAYDFCRKVTLSHYENFPVASILLPKKIRKHIFAVYAYSRIADDIADELMNIDVDDRLKYLNDFVELINHNNLTNPVFAALNHTINEKSLPKIPFVKLITAFKMDVEFIQANTIDDLYNYCTYSANPVGEIILRLFDLYDPVTSDLSDKICTALQLANFWQDFSRDIPNGRMFIPKDLLQKYNLNEENLFLTENSLKLKTCLNDLFDLTDKLFSEGEDLVKYLKPLRLKLEIKLTLEGGKAIMKKIRKLGDKTIKFRPKLLLIDIVTIFAKILI